MPKINRIRIANIQYDKKIIKDLFLNCYSGENMLLNLANGGGKSVLVQLLQQPILPESKIHGREVHSYLSPDQASYIFIEWKLDNSPKHYLLTGIVMSKLYSSDDMNKTKYFTFLNDYHTSNEFDIKNIPVIQKEENAVLYKSYEAAQEMIRSNKSLENLMSFGRGEQAQYREKLAEYGIFINEWKTLAKINENEGGVDELFKECKTSDSLVNKWILKTISDSNEAESKELKEMFVSLMQEIIEQESNLKEKEILEEFKMKIEEYEEPLKSLLEQLDKEKQVETDIYHIYLNLQRLSRENQEKIEEIAQKILSGEQELAKINYEEISEEYYHLQNDLEAIQEEKQNKQEELKKQEQVYANAKFQYRLQKVAYLYQKEKEANAKIEALNLKKVNLEAKSNSDEQLVKVEYSLQEKYKEKLAELAIELENIETENNKMHEEVINYKNQIDSNQKEMEGFSIQIGILQQKINNFEQEEKELFEKMGICLSRNLLNELEEKEVQEIKEGLKNKIALLQEEIEQTNKQIENIAKQIQELNQKEEQNNYEVQELIKQNTQKTSIYEAFTKQEEQVKQILNFHRIEEKYVFQKETYMPIILEKQLEYKRKIEELVSKIDRAKEYISDLERGGIHNSRELRKALDDANIGYITGEEYLKEQKEEYRKELLEKNPLLPYCYIVSKEDLEQIKLLEIKEETNKLSPIITFDNISKELAKGQKLVQIEEIYFLSLYHKECFIVSTKEYKEKLQKQLESYQNKKKEEEKELHRIEEHIHILEEFNYQEKDKKEMTAELLKIQRKIDEITEENAKNKEYRTKLQTENEEKTKTVSEKQNALQKAEKEQTEFLEYLNKNSEYYDDRKQKEFLETTIQNKKKENDNAQVKIAEADKQKQENLIKKSNLTQDLESIKEKSLKILPKQEKQEILMLSLEELEAQYEQLTKEYEQDRKLLDDQISIWNRTMADTKKEMQKEYGDIKQEEYALVHYSEEMEDLNKETKEKEENSLEQKKQELEKINANYIRIETQFNTSCDNLKKIGKQEPIPANQIKGNYEVRKKEIEIAKQEGKSKQVEYEKQNKKLQSQINDIDRNIDIKQINNNQENVSNVLQLDNINLPELIKQYKELKHANQTYKIDIYKKHADISSKYKEKHRIISAFLENVTIKEPEDGKYDTYYYIYEKMEECLKKLSEYIGILNLSLQNIEQDKKNILQHAVKQGIMLYQEMKKISDSSKVKIGEKYVQILKIEIPQELKEDVEQRISNHLEECIQSLREECKQSEDIRRTIENKVVIYLSDRKLLNLVLDVETIKVKLYKFDIENKNSGLRQWEEVIVENSGGQKFIACFALISALIEYTRRKELESLGEEEKLESSKVFVLDNPFGKTSSKHLLEPMIEISKKFNIQMICLSDLSQSSITDKFALIYQLALRSSKYTNNSFLSIEEQRINSEVTTDASLEQVYLRSHVEQMSFLN